LEALLALLTSETDGRKAWQLAGAVATLNPAAEDRAQTRKALLRMLGGEADRFTAQELAEAVAGLSPSVADLVESDTWPYPPTPTLLAAARKNSTLSSWLAHLPLSSAPARPATQPEGAPATRKNE